jgi:hypothetical protein
LSAAAVAVLATEVSVKTLWTPILGLAPALLAGAQADAQKAQPPAAKTPVRTQLDPGEVLCQRIVIAGSRIGSKTYCMTRLQWQEQRTGDREFTEKVQLPLQLRDGG